MTTISTTIKIQASSKQVWETLMNFENYPKWNPFITLIKYSDSTHQNLEVLLSPSKGNSMKFTPQVIRNIKEKEFAWQGKLFLKGIFDGYHSFHLKENEKGETTFIHNERFTGLLVPLFQSTLKTKTIKDFEKMNTALKHEVESLTKA
jgi:hypothetical protein